MSCPILCWESATQKDTTKSLKNKDTKYSVLSRIMVSPLTPSCLTKREISYPYFQRLGGVL